MTHDEFVQTLAACAPQYHWLIDTGKLRAVSAPNSEEEGYCPITLVCWFLRGEHYDVTEWKVAAYRLDLEDPEEIVHAADDDLLGTDSEEELREALLTAVGVEETQDT